MTDPENTTRGDFHPGVRGFPDYHIGTSATDVKLWTEQMARAMGYARVVWDSLPAQGRNFE